MANIVITDKGKEVLVEFNDKESEYNINSISIPKNSTALSIIGQTLGFVYNGSLIEIEPGDVTTPASANAEELRDNVAPFFFKIAVELIDFSLGAIYSTTSSGFASIPAQVLVPELADIGGGTAIKCKLAIDCFLDTGVEGEFELYNYTDSLSVADSQFTVNSNGAWLYIIGPEVEITPGKVYRIRSRRAAGSGNDKVYIEGGTLILRYE